MKAVPMQWRARHASWELNGHAADPIVGVGSVLKDVACHGPELNLLGCLFLVEFDGNWTSQRHFDGGFSTSG